MKNKKIRITLDLSLDMNGVETHEVLYELRQKLNSLVQTKMLLGYSDAIVVKHRTFVEAISDLESDLAPMLKQALPNASSLALAAQ